MAADRGDAVPLRRAPAGVSAETCQTPRTRLAASRRRRCLRLAAKRDKSNQFDMIPTEAELRKMIAGSVVGTTPPYDRGSPDDIEAFLAGVVGRLRGTRLLDVDAEFGHYGSGFASYVHVFCAKAGGESTTRDGDTDHIDGLIL